ALDRLRQPRPIESRFAQVGTVRHLAVHLAAVGRPAMARLTVAFLQIQPHPLGDVTRVGGRRLQPGRVGDRPAVACGNRAAGGQEDGWGQVDGCTHATTILLAPAGTSSVEVPYLVRVPRGVPGPSGRSRSAARV